MGIEPPNPPPPPVIFCTKCGERNAENNFKCTRCGSLLHGEPPPKYVAADDSGLITFIPYKNSQALLAYYLGIFSIIPCLGSPMGIAALVLGIRGLRFATAHPEAKGKVHAWVGIIAGGFFGLIYTAGIVFGVAMAIAKKHANQ